MLHNHAARGWGQAKTIFAKTGNLTIGVSLGSGYQNYFASLNSTQQQAVITQMKACGISWVRVDAEWWTVQPTSTGGFNWSQPDITVSALLTGGMNVLILLNESPAWARNAANTAPLYSPWATPIPSLYAAYCAAAATHYSAMGVHAYELWNEPNLDTGSGTAAGWGHYSPLGFAGLATAAYPAIKAADPKAIVLGGTLATYSELGTAGTARTGASWSTISAGSTVATVNCPNAQSGDAYGLLSDVADGWPLGTVITAVSPGVSWTVVPPVWSSSFPTIYSGSGKTVQVSNVEYPPDLFLTQAYAAAGGLPMWDALAIHPYTQPVMPAAQLPQFGGWAMVPTLRNTMIANGEGAKQIWITEVGAPTGASTGSWSSAASSATSLAVTCSDALADDVGYQLVASGIPTGAYINTVTSSPVGWTVSPPTGMTLATALTSGTPTTSLVIGPTPVALTIPSGTSLKVVVALSSTASNLTFSVTTSGSVTTSTTANTTITITSATPGYSYPVGSLVRGSVGQTWGTAISAGSGVATTILAPGVASAYGMMNESGQSALVTQVFRSIVSGIPANTGVVGSTRWPYVGPVFIYCWGDNGGTAGPFGLVRVDGTSKAAVQALTTVANTGGV